MKNNIVHFGFQKCFIDIDLICEIVSEIALEILEKYGSDEAGHIIDALLPDPVYAKGTEVTSMLLRLKHNLKKAIAEIEDNKNQLSLF